MTRQAVEKVTMAFASDGSFLEQMLKMQAAQNSDRAPSSRVGDDPEVDSDEEDSRKTGGRGKHRYDNENERVTRRKHVIKVTSNS